MLPAEGALFSPSVGERPFHPPRVSANDTPILRRRRRRRDRPLPKKGRDFRPRRARALQKGVQDTLGGFLIPPLATPPNLPPAATPCGRASKSEGEHGFYLCALLFLCAVALRLRGLPRMTVRGRMVQGGKSAAGNVFFSLNRYYPVFRAYPSGGGAFQITGYPLSPRCRALLCAEIERAAGTASQPQTAAVRQR